MSSLDRCAGGLLRRTGSRNSCLQRRYWAGVYHRMPGIDDVIENVCSPIKPIVKKTGGETRRADPLLFPMGPFEAACLLCSVSKNCSPARWHPASRRPACRPFDFIAPLSLISERVPGGGAEGAKVTRRPDPSHDSATTREGVAANGRGPIEKRSGSGKP